MRKSPCYIGARRIFLSEQVFGHRNSGSSGHLPICEHVGRGKTSGDFLGKKYFCLTSLAKTIPLNPEQACFWKEGERLFHNVNEFFSSCQALATWHKARGTQANTKANNAFSFPTPHHLLAWPSPTLGIYMGIHQTGASFPGLAPKWVDSGNPDAVFLSTCIRVNTFHGVASNGF